MTAKLIALLCIVIAFLLLGLWGYSNKVEAQNAVVARDAAIRDRDTAVTANKNNEAARLKAEADRAAADKLVSDLQDQIDAANQSTLDLANKITDLRTHNATVNDFLNLAIPDDILRVYDQSKAASRH